MKEQEKKVNEALAGAYIAEHDRIVQEETKVEIHEVSRVNDQEYDATMANLTGSVVRLLGEVGEVGHLADLFLEEINANEAIDAKLSVRLLNLVVYVGHLAALFYERFDANEAIDAEWKMKLDDNLAKLEKDVLAATPTNGARIKQ
jgi:hypothetical protein